MKTLYVSYSLVTFAKRHSFFFLNLPMEKKTIMRFNNAQLSLNKSSYCSEIEFIQTTWLFPRTTSVISSCLFLLKETIKFFLLNRQ